ncbi:chloride channel protein [Marinobacterium arenosum]|uniref:chloride channel protein n=1 Tax=Marinobacterium arenosum TaxID=2862496 RepID=UPI001C9735E6|nr:chloride channel protein [Marinobacterium arenosum]MBY4678304.1 chloride channel protein [Marinobacterium arenosum]
MDNPLWSLENFRDRLAHTDALPQLVILGVLSGIATALLISLFRLMVAAPLEFLLPHADAFESMPGWARFLLPVAGSLALIALLASIPAAARKVGVVHVLERISYHQSQLPLGNMLNQLACASIALISGHSVGREGPAIHIGAACSSLLGQYLHLPNNSLRLLVGCGSAAAIAAAFNTPLAGVIFAMEVILLEYSAVGFVPIMVAAVTADVTNRLLLGSEAVLDVPSLTIASLAEVPYIMLVGVLIGLIAAAFNHIVRQTIRLSELPLSLRLLCAGLLTGLVALWVPEVMGIGYDSVSASLSGTFGLQTLLILLLAKGLLTPLIIGLGVPGGSIGPTFFIGAMAGGAMGQIGASLVDLQVSESGFYAMLGMGAMMGAVLNAPLAALTALLELTGNPNIILPGMIAIVIGNLTVRYLLNTPSLFITTLRAQGLDYRDQPLSQALSRAAVGSLMSRQFQLSEASLPRSEAEQLCHQHTELLIRRDNQYALLPCADLRQWLDQHPEAPSAELFEIPAMRRDLAPISFRATLKEALDNMNKQGVDTLYVESNRGAILGLLSRQQLEQYYLQEQH